MADKEWDPDEPDPIDLQKQQIAMGKEFLARLKKQDEKEARERAEREAFAAASPPVARTYVPPSPEEVGETFKRAWEHTKRIMPDAPEMVQLRAFESLIHAYAPPPSLGGM